MSDYKLIRQGSRYQCPVCEKSYYFRTIAAECLQDHQDETEPEVNRYQCPVCDKSYSSKTNAAECLREHLKVCERQALPKTLREALQLPPRENSK